MHTCVKWPVTFPPMLLLVEKSQSAISAYLQEGAGGRTPCKAATCSRDKIGAATHTGGPH